MAKGGGGGGSPFGRNRATQAVFTNRNAAASAYPAGSQYRISGGFAPATYRVAGYSRGSAGYEPKLVEVGNNRDRGRPLADILRTRGIFGKTSIRRV